MQIPPGTGKIVTEVAEDVIKTVVQNGHTLEKVALLGDDALKLAASSGTSKSIVSFGAKASNPQAFEYLTNVIRNTSNEAKDLAALHGLGHL